jgi:hypothetical protein
LGSCVGCSLCHDFHRHLPSFLHQLLLTAMNNAHYLSCMNANYVVVSVSSPNNPHSMLPMMPCSCTAVAILCAHVWSSCVNEAVDFVEDSFLWIQLSSRRI